METSFDRLLARAKAAEDQDLNQFRAILSNALSAAGKAERNLVVFVFTWRRLAKFYLSVFDLDGAQRVLRKAQRLRLVSSERRMKEFEAATRELEAISAPVAAARLDLLNFVAGIERQYDEQRLVFFVPAAALSLNAKSNVYAGIRRVVAEIAESLKRNKIPHDFVFRLRNHGTPVVPDNIKYISHHTKGMIGNGLHFKSTDRPNCFSIDIHGYSGWASASQIESRDLTAVDVIKSENKFLGDRVKYIGGNVSKYNQTASVKGNLPGVEWIFVALQTIDDAVQQLARVEMLEMLRIVASEGRRRGIPVVVKRHPRCNSKVVSDALKGGLARRDFFVSRASVHELISGSCAVCTVNSSVGAEALLHLKPVYVFGSAEYQYACHRILAPEDFGAIFSPNSLPISRDEIVRFLYYLRTDFAHDLDSVNFNEYLDRKIKSFVDA